MAPGRTPFNSAFLHVSHLQPMKIRAESAHMKTHAAILLRNVTIATGKRINGSQLSQFKLCVKKRAEGEESEQAPPKRTESLRCLALLSVISVFTEIYV